MVKVVQILGQAVFYLAAAGLVGYFAAFPLYEQFPEGQAQIKLSFAHGAARTKECRRLTPQEIAKLPANERRPNTCSRERIDMQVQLLVDDESLLEARLKPTGLSGDGPARVYHKFIVSPGKHVITARLRDSRKSSGYDYETRREVNLSAGQNMAVDFKADAGGFIFR